MNGPGRPFLSNTIVEAGANGAPCIPRPLRRAIERLTEDPMAEPLLREELEEMKTTYDDIDDIDEADEKLTFSTEPPTTTTPEQPADEPASSEA
ncbi:MAG: ATP-dependent Clp protease ATP-binding subunit ClpA [Planctomycetota bacterium]|jgi:ATP-dependent Clp protease ATP-binding subunit ClpA